MITTDSASATRIPARGPMERASEYVQAASRGVPLPPLTPFDEIVSAVLEGKDTLERAVAEVGKCPDARCLEADHVSAVAIAVDLLIDGGRTRHADILAQLQYACAAARTPRNVALTYSDLLPVLKGSISAVTACAADLGWGAYDIPRFEKAVAIGSLGVAATRDFYENALAAHDEDIIVYLRVQLARALYSLANLRRVVVDERDPSFWEEMTGGWRQNLRGHVHELPLDADPDGYRLKHPVEQIDAAVAEFGEAALLYEELGDARAGSAHLGAAVLLTQAVAWRPGSRDEALAHIERARTLGVDGSGAAIRTLFLRLGVSDPSAGEIVFDFANVHSDDEARRLSAGALAYISAIRASEGPAAAADEMQAKVIGLDLAALEPAQRSAWYHLFIHALDRGRVDCTDGQRTQPISDRYAALHLLSHLRVDSDAGDLLTHVLDDDITELDRMTAFYCAAERVARVAQTYVDGGNALAAAHAMNSALQGLLGALAEDEIMRILTAAADLADTQDAPTAMDVGTLVVAGCEVALDSHPSPRVRGAFHQLGREVDREDPREPVHPTLVHPPLHRWLFKAVRLGDQIVSGRLAVLDDAARQALDRAAEFERVLDGVPIRPLIGSDLHDLESQRLAVLDPRETHGGGGPAEQLANLRRRFEAARAGTDGALALGFARPEPDQNDVIRIHATAASGRTATWNLTQGVDPERKATINSSIEHFAVPGEGEPIGRWSGDTLTTRAGLTGYHYISEDGLSRVYLHPAAIPTLECRIAVQQQPRKLAVSDETALVLRRNGELFLGTFRPLLSTLKDAGCDHLCAIPTGPLMFMPLHLLMDEAGRPLADEWIVTYLPSPRLLAPRHELPAGSGTVIVAAPRGGKSFGLPDIPELELQAGAIHEAVGGTLLPDSTTPAEILDAAARARYLHIAAHGTDYAAAPAFQTLYLGRGETRDARLFAYEVAQRDLSSLDLVTLSACETALGRMDAGDNLHGLVASFLQAGVMAVIAALWEVPPAASSTFFTHLYTRLHDLPLLDAYRSAQEHTRVHHPGYRDWGGFVLFGDWRQRGVIV